MFNASVLTPLITNNNLWWSKHGEKKEEIPTKHITEEYHFINREKKLCVMFYEDQLSELERIGDKEILYNGVQFKFKGILERY